jgi:hypothetical protein
VVRLQALRDYYSIAMRPKIAHNLGEVRSHCPTSVAEASVEH